MTDIVSYITKRLKKEITPREKEIIRLKVQCLIENPEYNKMVGVYYSEKYDNSSVENREAWMRDFRFVYGIQSPVRPNHLKGRLRNPDWVNLKNLFTDMLPYNIKVIDAPLTEEDIDEKILRQSGALPDQSKRPDLYKLKQDMIEYEGVQTDVTIKINLLGNKKKILSDINSLLLTFKKRVMPTSEINVYKRCLKVYLTRHRSHRTLTYEELADREYPGSRNSNSAVMQVKRDYKKGEWLIKEGYKQLR